MTEEYKPKPLFPRIPTFEQLEKLKQKKLSIPTVSIYDLHIELMEGKLKPYEAMYLAYEMGLKTGKISK